MPRFTACSSAHPEFRLDEIAGRYVVLCFLAATALPENAGLLEDLKAARQLFEGDQAVVIVVTIDPRDSRDPRLAAFLPKIPAIWDFDRAVSALFGALGPPGADGATLTYYRRSVVIDPQLRLLDIVPSETVGSHVATLAATIERAIALDRAEAVRDRTPVLVVPRVFEYELCRALIGHYDDVGGIDSGFMLEEGGMTVGRIDHSFKRRFDVEVRDEALQAGIRHRIHDRLKPELRKAFRFEADYIERYLVARYDAETRGHFAQHRDNTTKGTAHRCFAVSIALNDESEYRGGDLRFPEYGRRKFRVPLGSALVFSGGILHEVLPVTAGTRFMLVPFLYDEAARLVRDENLRYVADNGAVRDGRLILSGVDTASAVNIELPSHVGCSCVSGRGALNCLTGQARL